MSAGLAASTVTPGSTAPDGSFTTPAIDACANSDAGNNSSEARTIAARNTTRISCLRLSAGTLYQRWLY
jgi:hypothetical protein